MRSAAARGRLTFIIAIALALGCSPSQDAGPDPTATPLALARCAEASGILCVATFGIMPPDKMLVAVTAPVGGLSDIQLRVTHRGVTSVFACTASEDFPNSFNCTGPQAQLGSTIHIDVMVIGADVVLAGGDFFLSGFAVPTVQLQTPPPPGAAYPTH
jgi:hypothetical protein